MPPDAGASRSVLVFIFFPPRNMLRPVAPTQQPTFVLLPDALGGPRSTRKSQPGIANDVAATLHSVVDEAGLSDGPTKKWGHSSMRSLVPSIRMLAGAVTAAALLASGATAALPGTAFAASCVRSSASNFDSPGDDNQTLNQEWVRIKNFCSTKQTIGGWKIHDRGTIHTYRFASGVAIGPGASITLHTGKGSNNASNRYWGLSSAVWNNDGDTASLVNGAGKTVSSWTR